MLIHVCLQLLPLALQRLQTFIQRLPTAAMFHQWLRPSSIGIAHTLELASQLIQPTLQLGAPRLQFLR